MSKPIITFPCKYQPNDLEKRGDSHFCQSCDHSVIDFRNATEAEINSTLTSSEKKTCGIFHSNQVTQKTTIIPIGIQRRIGLSLFGILGLISPVVTSSCETETPENTESKNLFDNFKFPLFLRGKLVDQESKAPLKNAVIKVLQQDKILVAGVTNENGDFIVALNRDELSDEKFDLILENTGYISDTIKKNKYFPSTFLELVMKVEPTLPDSYTYNRENVTSIPLFTHATLGFVGLERPTSFESNPLFCLELKKKKENNAPVFDANNPLYWLDTLKK
ncbi:MAG: hypothetical protein QE487_08870 [Fluviicola sp.]|nr:hypothetical protein [Fluviicola sp.]